MNREDTAQFILQALSAIKKSCKKQLEETPDKIKPGIIENVSRNILLVQKIRSNDKKTIGIFGAQKRGKSSLINQLIGCDLMPISPIPMSSVAIKIKQDPSIPEGKYKIDIYLSNGEKNITQTVELDQAKMNLQEYGSHKGILSGDVDTIEVSSSFPNSKILKNGGILVDTPGAEFVFGQGKEVDDSNIEDRTRAINILTESQIVVFVERADQMESNNSKHFFDVHLRQMRPLGVLNWKDEFGNCDPKYDKIKSPEMREKEKMRDMQRIMLRTYGFNLDHLLCVSCKEAMNAKENNNLELLKKSNLPLLEGRILEELQNLNHDNGLFSCLEDIESILHQIEDNDLARTVFQNAQRPFYVFTHCEKNDVLRKKASDLYKNYCSNQS